jgi:hypothetical protein
MPYLTTPEGEDVARQRYNTPPGMAHWEGSGPSGKTCRECRFWGWSTGPARHRENGLLKPQPCAKYRQFAMRGGNKVPYSAGACKYFEPTGDAPPRVNIKKGS